MENKYDLSYEMQIADFIEKFPIMKRYWSHYKNNNANFDNRLFAQDTNHFPPAPFADCRSMTYCLDVLEKMGKDITKEWA